MFDFRVTFRSSLVTAALSVLAFGSTVQAWAEDAYREIETKYIFGFTEGSGIGLEGEKEFSPDSVTKLGKRAGSYSATETKLKYEFTPSQYIQFELGPIVSSHRIRSVPDLDDRSTTAFGGGFVEFRYLLFSRPSSPLAVTLAIEPEWHRTDETSGQHVQNYALETRINADLEVIPNRSFLGFNLLYEPETTRDAAGVWNKEATIGASAAFAWRILPSFVVGAETWYLRHYDGIGLSTYTGDAVYVGPNVYWQITPKTFVTAAWNAQVSGHDVDDPGKLNLTEFSRQRVKLKLAIEF